MNINSGDIVEGEVVHVAAFGVFVRINLEDEKVVDGLVHISEVANEYVKDINQYVALGNKIMVKVLGLNKQGKYELSMKKAVKVEKPSALFLHAKASKDAFDDGFENLLNNYLKRSEDKQIDIRRNLKKKQGIKKKK